MITKDEILSGKRYMIKRFNNMSQDQKWQLYDELILVEVTTSNIEKIIDLLYKLSINDVIDLMNMIIHSESEYFRVFIVHNQRIRDIFRNISRYMDSSRVAYDARMNEFKKYKDIKNYQDHGSYI